jgi:hypothetical protein
VSPDCHPQKHLYLQVVSFVSRALVVMCARIQCSFNLKDLVMFSYLKDLVVVALYMIGIGDDEELSYSYLE